MLESVALDRLVWLGSAWLLLAGVWMAFCVWVDTDCREILGKRFPGPLAFVLAGAVLFFATYQYGLSTVPVFAILLPAGVCGYVVYRDAKAPSTRRIISRRFLRTKLLEFAEKFGIDETVGRWLSEGRGPAKPGLLILKNDDTPVDGGRAQGFDWEAKKAMKHVQHILEQAIDMRATDIQLEPKADEQLMIRCRIDGVMQNVSTLKGSQGRAVISALKACSLMNIADQRRPQGGTFAVFKSGRKWNVRSHTSLTNIGEKMAMQMLDANPSGIKGGLTSLGMSDGVLKTLQAIVQQPHGMLIVCGPTGSGKTTTLYNTLSEIDFLSRDIITIEDPIECQLKNITQMAVDQAADLTFAKILRSVVRQDPNVIMVGEIGDKETAEIAMQAAMKNRFVFTSLRTNDTATTVAHLLDIGLDASLIRSAVTAVLAQRLVRVLCAKCKEPYAMPDDLRQKLGIPADKAVTIYRENGCPACYGTGFKGRTGVHELLVFDNAIRGLLVGQPSMQTIRTAARKGGMRTLQETGIAKVLSGVTSLNELTRVMK